MSKERMLILACSVLLLACVNVACSKSNQSDLSFWTGRAGAREQLSPGFSDSARKLWSAIEQERQDLDGADNEFRSSQSTALKVRSDVAKRIGTKRDRDLYYLLQAYEQKVGLLHTLSRNPSGMNYLVPLRTQIQSCHDALQELFAHDPIQPPPVLPVVNDPCTEPVPSVQ